MEKVLYCLNSKKLLYFWDAYRNWAIHGYCNRSHIENSIFLSDFFDRRYVFA